MELYFKGQIYEIGLSTHKRCIITGTLLINSANTMKNVPNRSLPTILYPVFFCSPWHFFLCPWHFWKKCPWHQKNARDEFDEFWEKVPVTFQILKVKKYPTMMIFFFVPVTFFARDIEKVPVTILRKMPVTSKKCPWQISKIKCHGHKKMSRGKKKHCLSTNYALVRTSS